MKEILTKLTVLLGNALGIVVSYALERLSAIPGFPDFYSVDYAMSGLTKMEDRLIEAARRATAKAEAFSDLADQYDEMSEAAFAEADRAAKVQMRLSRLLG